MKKRGKKSTGKKGNLNDKLALFVFVVAGYISLNVLVGMWYNVLGTVFLITALYGVVTVGKGVRFVF